ncbi:MAG: class I SAM-dependent DNA methyltransferase [Proteobacteria bacterium]|nr:class I SAM-dependent DNA methyltransferase [Pseudomonadota bacterium]
MNCIASTIKENLTKTHQKLEDYLAKNHLYLQNFSGESWIISNQIEAKIKAKIEAVGVKLKDWDIKINRGILTGFNEAFIINTKTKEELCLADPKSAEIIKPILRGRDISRYSAKWAGLWVIVAKHQSHQFLEKNYPAIFTYLQKFQSQLQKRGQCTNKGGKGQHHWLELDNNPTDEYLGQFEKEKIVYSEIVRQPQFHYDEKKYFPEATSFLITGKDIKFLVSILNSKPFTYFFNRFYAGGGLGDEGFRYKKKFLETCPITQIPASSQAPFIKIVDEILSITNQTNYNPDFPPLKQQELEAKIDEMVCDLYQLDDEEKKLILGEKSVL